MEDNFDAGKKDLKDANFCEKDVVVAISASGNAAYCVGALIASANNIGILNKEFELTIKKCLKI